MQFKSIFKWIKLILILFTLFITGMIITFSPGANARLLMIIIFLQAALHLIYTLLE